MKLWLRCVYCAAAFLALAEACNRKPQGANGERSPVDENFQILIEGNPSTYIPGQRYNVSLACDEALKFISFTLVVESEIDASSGYDMLGHFEIIDVAETKFSTLCENMLESANTNGKTRVTVAWIAPTNPKSGCVLLKAAVLQHRNVWFIDDGLLTKRICPEEIDEVNSQSPPIDPCCACDEAKYELVIERKWNRNTHAKDFPVEAWRTRFSEIIGASHTQAYRFWEYGSLASRGIQEMAEHGSTQALEAEIKAGEIRTIIKAPGILYRNNNILGSTLANVRVDPDHHVISLVSKIEPSPDWILGVAGLELCLENCTWINEKVLNLYPWDIGTDAGPSYMSPDQPQVPPDVVRRITSSFPSDHRSPFYDESGAPMKPLATLYIRKKKLYERECDSAENVPLECATHPWNNWSECSTKCGPGMQFRTRAYKDVALAQSFNCQVVLNQAQKCMGNQCGVPDSEISNSASAECELTTWGPWSECSNRCGKGFSRRIRNYVNSYVREKCQSGVQIELEQTKECEGENCGGTILVGGYETNNEMDPQIEDNEEQSLFGETLPDNHRYSNRPKPNRWSGGAEIPRKYGPQSPRPLEQYEHGNYASNFQSPDFGNNDIQFEEPGISDINEFTNTRDRNRISNNAYITPSNNEYQNRNSNEYNLTKDREFSSEGIFKLPSGSWRDDQTPTTQDRYSQNNRFISQSNVNTPYHQPPDIRNSNNQPIDNIDSNLQNNDLGIHRDEHGYKTVMVGGTSPTNYAVVQERCFQKPYASRITCSTHASAMRNFWFYDADDRQCKLFTGHPCDENTNKFTSLEACEGDCLHPHRNFEAMQQPNPWNEQFGESHSLIKPPSTRRRPYRYNA